MTVKDDTPILITGGAGFIGSHLADQLLDSGKGVVALDNLDTGRADNIRHLFKRDNFTFVQGSILDENLLETWIDKSDQIFHLAASVGVELVMRRPMETLDINTRGTDNVLRISQKLGNKKVVLASTSEVYGNSGDIPFREDQTLMIGPPNVARWGYACSKLYDEFLSLSYHQAMGLPVVILRLFNTVGPRQSSRYGMVLPRFVSQALENSPITIYGDGLQTRCFTDVKDVVSAMIRINQNHSAIGEIFNLGNDNEITIIELAHVVRDTLASKSDIVKVPYHEAYQYEFEDIRHRVPDLSKIKRYIEYHPSTDLPNIIQQIAMNYKTNGSKRDP